MDYYVHFLITGSYEQKVLTNSRIYHLNHQSLYNNFFGNSSGNKQGVLTDNRIYSNVPRRYLFGNSNGSYYDILGVSRSASPKEVSVSGWVGSTDE